MSRTLLRNSERTTFKTCRFKWALNFGAPLVDTDGSYLSAAAPLRSREPAKALWFGDLVHQALAAYYRPGTKRGRHPAKVFAELYDADGRLAAVQRNEEGEWESLRDLGVGMLTGYVERFADADEEWEVIASEQTFQLPLTVPAMELSAESRLSGQPGSLYLPAFRIYVVGTFDGIWRHRLEPSRIAFKEFKTAASINTDGLAMDDQAGFYWTYGPRWAWKQGWLPRKTYPSEILYSFLRKAIPNDDKVKDAEGRVLNKPTKADLLEAFPHALDEGMSLARMIEEVGEEKAALAGQPSKNQPPPYFERLPIYRDEADRWSLHTRVLAEAREIRLARAGILAPIKNPGPLHMPNCRGCAFRDACELHESGNDWTSMLRATTEAWDPYEAHELIERR